MDIEKVPEISIKEFTFQECIQQIDEKTPYTSVCQAALRLELIDRVVLNKNESENYTEEVKILIEKLGMPEPIKNEDGYILGCMFVKDQKMYFAVNPLPLPKGEEINVPLSDQVIDWYEYRVFPAPEEYSHYFGAVVRCNVCYHAYFIFEKLMKLVPETAKKNGIDPGDYNEINYESRKGSVDLTFFGSGRGGAIAWAVALELFSMYYFERMCIIDMLNGGKQFFTTDDGLKQMKGVLKEENSIIAEIETPDVSESVEEPMTDEEYTNHELNAKLKEENGYEKTSDDDKYTNYALSAAEPNFKTKTRFLGFKSPWLAKTTPKKD